VLRGRFKHFRSLFFRSLLKEGEYFIIKTGDYFVQFAGQADHRVRAEAVSNTFIKESAPLSDKACQALRKMGWNPPTYVPSDGAGAPAEGSPNFYLDADPPVAYARLAALAAKTLRTIYRTVHSGALVYEGLSREAPAILSRLLRVAGEPAPPVRSGSTPPAGQRKALAAPKGSSGRPQFTLPDGQPIAPEQVEANLRARVTTCEEALVDALWQLARFYSLAGRQADATACVDRCLASTRDPVRQAGGFLGLGQLLEQQDRYAEAEAMYARGLEIPSASGDVAYFLYNNRGYCLNLLGRHADAETYTRAAIGIDPARHNAHKNLGLALAGQGRLLEAAHCLLEADRRNPADGRARQHLAELLTDHPELLTADPALAAACGERGIRPARVGNA
jgi:tetratricopeptide (TPR) repeat protein